MIFLLRVYLLLSLLLIPIHGAVTVAAQGTTKTQDFPSVPLRGYGTLAGTYREWTLPGGAASILEIHSPDEAKAKIVHAKYISDLQNLPGTVAVPAGTADPLASFQITKQNFIAAVRNGNTVYVLNAVTRDDLHALFNDKLTGDKATLALAPEVKVPMFLDRWDQFGYRFYYYPWTQPGKGEGEVKVENYDPATEFTYADDHDRCGFLFWTGPLKVDSAENILNDHYVDWAIASAHAKNLPTAINITTGDPVWLANRFINEQMMKMPGFVGQFNGIMRTDGAGQLSWNSQVGNDEMLATVQQAVRRFGPEENIVSWLEPHGELDHGDQDALIDYGPAADEGYRRFLQAKYKDIGTLNQRWYGAAKLKSWDQVRVPELAFFAGGDERAVDLTGRWKVGYELDPNGQPYKPEDLDKVKAASKEEIPTTPAPAEWFTVAFDDSAWPEVYAPGDDELFIKYQPAVFRQTVNVPAAKHAQGQRWWLYVWDFNLCTPKEKMMAYVNGAKVGESPYHFNELHWDAYEVTSQLKDGANQISLRLPRGYLAYRAYLSPQEPKSFPDLGENLNAQWADFSDWRGWSHGDILHRGAAMIRQVDPDRQITFMHPDKYSDQIKKVVTDYGGEFHCTGYMSGFFAEYGPMVMRGVDMPSSLEPGGPAHNLADFKKQMGLNFTEGIQSIDYFIHIGDVMWHPDISQYFTDNLKLFKSIGRYHPAKAETALFFSERELHIGSFPWRDDPNTIIGSGYWQWNVSMPLVNTYPFDGVTESDFADGNVSKYKAVIDTNTEILDEDQVNQIERYVREGGIFITYVETGRHTSLKKDSWPICRLTGYNVTHIDQFDAKGKIEPAKNLKVAPDQTVFPPGDWDGNATANGLALEKREKDCQDLMLWDNGEVAIGMRPIGKGYIVQVGARFRPVKMPDRWEGKALHPEEAALAKMLTQLLDSFHITHLPAHLPDPTSMVTSRCYVSNNGLYDVWVLYNRDKETTLTESLIFDNGLAPTKCIEIVDGKEFPIAEHDGTKGLENIVLEPLQTRVFVTPKPHLEAAGIDWLNLQRNWWKGTAPVDRKLAPVQPKFALNLDADWAFHPVTDGETVDPMLAATFDDAKWERRQIDVWSLPNHHGVNHGIYRKTFTVPANWTSGQVSIWMKAFFSVTFVDKGRVFLDGKQIVDWTSDGVPGNDGDGTLKPGSQHTLAVEITSAGALAGCRGSAWLAYEPTSDLALDLAGEWEAGDNVTMLDKKAALPGPWDSTVFRRTFQFDPKFKGKNAILEFDGPTAVDGALINHHWIEHCRMTGQTRWRLNITPWLKPGGDNEILLRGRFNHPERESATSIKILFFEPGTYP